MPISKYLIVNTDGRGYDETETVDVSAGAGDAGKILSLNSVGQVDESFLSGRDIVSTVASGAIPAGAFVNLFDNGGTMAARLADKSNNRPAHGYTKTAVADTEAVAVFSRDNNDQLSGLTPGGEYWLDTAGGVTDTPTNVSAELRQYLGIAIADDTIDVLIDPAIEMA
ncbi:MAG: hypothetical protein AAGA65_09170 [Actinomycetota bacterium]